MNLHIDLINGGEVTSFLAALLDTNMITSEQFFEQFNKLSISKDVDVTIRQEYDGNEAGKKITIIDKAYLLNQSKPQKKTLKDVLRMIVSGGLSSGAELIAVKIFENLSSCYAAIDSTGEEISSSLDNNSIASVLGLVIVLDLMRFPKTSVSNINVGSGVVVRNMSVENVPTQAVKLMLKKFITFGDDRQGELVSPLLAAVIETIVNAENVEGQLLASGLGLNDKLFFGHQNMLKVKLYDSVNSEEEETMNSSDAINEVKEYEEQKTANSLENSFKKIDKIMRAMEDLESSLKSSAARQNERTAAKAQDCVQDVTEKNFVEDDLLAQNGQDAILAKIKQIESRLKVQVDTKPTQSDVKIKPQTEYIAPSFSTKRNSSIEKFERLEREAGLYKPTYETHSANSTADTLKSKVENRRAELDEKLDDKVNSIENNSIIEITSNIDNSTGEELGYLAELILANGAYDVYFESIYTNSFKPAYKLSAIIDAASLSLFSKLILLHSGTVRVKYTNLSTIDLKSTTVKKSGKYGDVMFERISGRGDIPRFADRKEIAKKYNLTLREVEKILGEDYE